MMNRELLDQVTFGLGAMLTAYTAARVKGKPRAAMLEASIMSFAETGFQREELEYMVALAIDQLAQRVIELREAS
jgi:hypothetical protein